MLYLYRNCVKETVGYFEISIAFESHGFGYIAVFDNDTEENVTQEVFGIEDKAASELVEASISNLITAKAWCEGSSRIRRE